MEVYDLIMLAVLVGATIFGAWKGLAWQIASLGAIVASCFVSFRFYGPLAEKIDAKEPWNIVLAMLILYVGTSLAIWVLFRFVSGFIDRLKLKEFDRQLGALLGLAKGVLLCVIITLFAVSLAGDSERGQRARQSIIQSRSGYYIARLLDKSHAVIPEKVHDALHRYIHSLDERLSTGERTVHDHAASGLPPSDASGLVPVEELLQAFDPQQIPARR